MYKINKDEFIVLNSKVNSPSLASIAGDAVAEDEAAATASLVEKGILEGNVVSSSITELIDILDNSPEIKVTRFAAVELQKSSGPDMGNDGGGGGG
ncbi:MAG: hypothetical protein LBN43_07520, partial [Oscillospiraceae bacterium]|nr:hypothetical protein [Oscillospiraceae bacterium]